MKLKLPKEYVSKSQLALWRKSKKEYAKRYFEGKKGFKTKEMQFGTEFEDSLSQTQTEIKVGVGGVELFGIMDYFNAETMLVRDDKTGKTPWTEDRAFNSIDVQFYSLVVFKKHGVIPDFQIKWYETKNDDDGNVAHTGEGKLIQLRYTEMEISEIEKTILKEIEEISEAYKDFLEGGKVPSVVKKYESLKEKQKKIDEQIKELAPSVIKEIEDCAMDHVGNITLVRSTRYDNSPEVKEKIKKLKSEDDNKIPIESISLRYNPKKDD